MTNSNKMMQWDCYNQTNIGTMPFHQKKRENKIVYNKNFLLLKAFAIFCGLGINNTQTYETVMKAMAKQRIALECLSYHASAPADEAQRLKVRNATHLVELCSKYIWAVDKLNASNCSKHCLSFPIAQWVKVRNATQEKNASKYIIEYKVPICFKIHFDDIFNTSPTPILNPHTNTSTCTCNLIVPDKITILKINAKVP